MKRGWIVLGLALVALYRPTAASQPSPAPALEFPDERGAATSLASFRGRVVLVDVWASWCAPCKVAFPQYNALFKQYHDRGFDVLAVNVDARRADADRFLASRPHEIKVLFDPKGIAPKRLGLKGMPTSYLVDRTGTIRERHEGFTEDDVITYRHQIEALLAELP